MKSTITYTMQDIAALVAIIGISYMVILAGSAYGTEHYQHETHWDKNYQLVNQ